MELATSLESTSLSAKRPVVAKRILTATGPAALGFVLIYAFSLSRSLFDPIGYDQALYQYMAERIIAGERLYVDVWDQNGPGIVAIHWLSTHLVGSSPIALRIFDAVWQALTILCLAGLVWRDGREWPTAWLAAGLYALSYYSLGYVQTAQREGFAVLPLLLMAHLVMAGGNSTGFHTALRFFIAGMLGLFVFTIKPPLGLVFGVMWLYTLTRMLFGRNRACKSNAQNVHSHRPDAGATPLSNAAPYELTPLVALSAGFIAAAAGAVALLMHLGSWDGCWGILSRRDMPGYVLGPTLIRSALPGLAIGAFFIALLSIVASRLRIPRVIPHPLRLSVIGWTVFALLLTCRQWPDWRHVLVCFAGLWIPAIGSILLRSWRERGEAWRLTLLLLLTSSGAVILQGQFFLYHLPPMLAAAAVLASLEISDCWSELQNSRRTRPAWFAACAGSILYLALGQWWPTMTFVTAHPFVLANTSLADHYTSITKHKLSCPTYATTIKVTDRIRELTNESDPIASLFHEARIYYFARRPSVHKLICMQVAYEHMFADYMQAIRDKRPKVIVARVPERLRQSRDLPAIEAAIFDEAESFFGPPGRTIRELYHAAELIDDVCLLKPRQEKLSQNSTCSR